MASPQPLGKKPVNLASPGPAGSRIRRDPPPVMKVPTIEVSEEQEQWAVVVGILTFALAIFFLIIAFGSYAGWSPAQYTVNV